MCEVTDLLIKIGSDQKKEQTGENTSDALGVLILGCIYVSVDGCGSFSCIS